MDPISLVTSRWGPKLVMMLCRIVPRGVIRRLGRWLAAYLSRRDDLPFVRALLANQGVVHGLQEGHPRVRRAVALLLENTIASYADLFRMVQSGSGEGRIVCEIGSTQGRAASELFMAYRPVIRKDMYGLDRSVVGTAAIG